MINHDPNAAPQKSRTQTDTRKKIATGVVLALILSASVLIRIQGTQTIPTGQFTSNDGYFYYWQARLISEHGRLPERDMHRWLPLGRDLGQTLNLYGYVLAYTHKALTVLLPTLSLYHVAFYAPVFFFCLAVAVLCRFLSHTDGGLFSSMVGVFLATLPGAMLRSVAGFGDRDSWCFLLGVLAVTTYLRSLTAKRPSRRLFWTLASGGSVYLGGISWEGFGGFISIILCVELWRFLTSETEDGLAHYLLWVLTFVPTLYLSSEAYRNGYGFAKHLFAFLLVPPVVLFGIRALRSLLLSNIEKRRPYARSLALGITLASTAVAIGYVLIQRHTFADTTVPFSQTPLMQNVGELKEPSLRTWQFRYGSVFLLGGLGAVIAAIRLWKMQGLTIAVPLAFFAVTAFYRSPLDAVWGTATGNLIFGAALAACLLGFLVLAWRRQDPPENERTAIAFLLWFCFWAGLARTANRYDFFLGMCLAYFTADLIRFLSDFYGHPVKKSMPQQLLKNGLTAMMLLLILLWEPVGGHAKRAVFAAPKLRRPIPGTSSVADAFVFMKRTLPRTAIVAANWSYGSQLNVLAGVKTIIDQDHYIQNWIHLYNQQIYAGNAEHAALTFLKSHTATHLMLRQGMETSDSFLHKAPSDAFLPVYPTEDFETAPVKVWEIHYPPDIQADPKYLRTGIPEIDAQLPEH